jgi:hypothetical protein
MENDMSRNKKQLSASADLTHLISVGHLAMVCPRTLITRTLEKLGKQSVRVRLFPAQVVVYFVILMPLWREPRQEEILRIVSDCLSDLFDDLSNLKLPTKGAICKAREKLGSEVLETLAKEILRPIARAEFQKAFYHGMRIVSLEKTNFDLPDSKANSDYFGFAPEGTGTTIFPMCQTMNLVESATQVVIDSVLGTMADDEINLASTLLDGNKVTPDMLVLLNHKQFDQNLWQKTRSIGANLLWAIDPVLKVPADIHLTDNSYITTVEKIASNVNNRSSSQVRVIEATYPDGTPLHLATSLLDSYSYTSKDLISLFKERVGNIQLFNEIETRVGGNKTIVKSKVPDLVRQEIWGIFILQFALRQLLSFVSYDPEVFRHDKPPTNQFLKAAGYGN